MTNKISLYFHIPFCVKKCDYCAFFSLPSCDDKTKQEYFEALMRQIAFFDTNKTIDTVYFGGGTPTVLGVDRLCKLIAEIRRLYKISDDFEMTIEVNPKTVDHGGLKMLYDAGFNRLSVGVQSANDRILASIGRIHSFSDAKQCIEDARSVGFGNISADIMFALPDQSIDDLRESVELIMSTNVDHISCYSLQVEAGTPLYNKRKTLNLPDESLEEAQYDALCEIMRECGFVHYEISSFAKNGYESRHNLNYWARNEYFGFGAGAHSFFDNRRFFAECDISYFIGQSYISAFAPTNYDESDLIDEAEAFEEYVMLGLRTRYGVLLPEHLHGKAKQIADYGYGVFNNGRLTLNSKGFRVSNSIISDLLV